MGVSCLDEALPPTMRLPLSGITVLSLEQAIANARRNGVEDFLHHPQLHSRKRIRPVASEAGLQETFSLPSPYPAWSPSWDPFPRSENIPTRSSPSCAFRWATAPIGKHPDHDGDIAATTRGRHPHL